MTIKNERKLVRGLQDISSFFTSSGVERGDKKEAIIAEQVLERSAAKEMNPVKKDTFPEVYCFALQPLQAHKRLLHRANFIEAMKAVFSEVYFLSFSANRRVDSTEQERVRQLVLPPFQIYDILHPKPVSSSDPTPVFDPEKRVCFFLEPKSMFEFRTDLFRLLDHVILNVSADSSESILAAYQTLSACLHRDPTLHFSILIDGSLADDVVEVIYERFSKITSQFLGCEIDFLGWIEEEKIHINYDLLLNSSESGRIIRKPLKIQLMQLLSEELMLDAA